MTLSVASARQDERRVISNVTKGSIGNLIEWYDWYTYAVFSVYFAATFFPRGNATAQLLNTAAIFAVGFLMRPIGGWLLGCFADRYGRRTALTWSVTMMALSSLLIAVTPGYDMIGAAAPIMLVLARLLQGLSVGGEYATSATYLSEVASAGWRGFYSSFQYVTLIAGQLVALGLLIVLQLLLTEQQLAGWGWRIAFGICGLGAVVVMYLRRSMDESVSFRAEFQRTHNPLGGFAVMLAGLVIVSGYTSINAIVKAEFPTGIRALGVSLPYALTVAIFGGTTEYIALALKTAGHESVLISLLVYMSMRETSRDSPLESG